jgi:putative membrane protein
MRTGFLATACAVLGSVWLGPLPALARQSVAAHMTMHIAVVAVAAPLIALAIAGTRGDPVRARPRLFAPIAASMIELVIVWAWHVPALHHAARHQLWALLAEQGSFIAAGVLLWVAALGGTSEQRRLRAGAGIFGLLFTSMHMTLLGALLALANRPLFRHAPESAPLQAVLADQHLGGSIMLLVGGASYLAGGLWLTAVMLRCQAGPSHDRRASPS